MKRLLLALTAAAIAAAPGCSSAPPPAPTGNPQAATSLPPSAVSQIESLLAEKAARTPAQRKIASQLLYMQSGRFTSLKGKTGEIIQSQVRTDAQGRVLVDVKGGTALQSRIESLGGTMVSSSAAHGSARAWLSLDRLDVLASDAGVQSIRPALSATTNHADPPRATEKFAPRSREERIAAVQQAVEQARSIPRSPDGVGAATLAGSVTSEGSKAHGADRARKFFNADGTGIRIGVLSDSDDFKEQSISTGDLPADTVTVPGQDGRPGSGEGTAMMEIVHDVAPGAKLFFASAFNSPESFADNIRSLRFDFHCDVIIDDVIYFFESPYQDDIIAQAVDDVTADGASYFSSAGNGGSANDGTSGTWEGDFKNAGALATLPSGYEVHDFGGGVISNRIEVSGGPLILHWSDAGTLDVPAAFNDYDVFVLNEDLRNVLIASTDVQDGDDLPSEFIGFGLPTNARVVIARHPGAKDRAVRAVLFGGEFAIGTGGSTFGHNSAKDAFGVAAVDVAEAVDGLFAAGPTTPVELFSSDGQRRVFYDRNGNLIGTGEPVFACSAGETRKKPDLAAADGVSTTLPSFSGLNPFFGTSAAAPHAGAIAGLIKSAVPNISPAKLRKALLSGAIDIAEAGADRDSGSGIASAFEGLSRAGAKPAAFLEAGTVSVTPSSGDAILPGGSAQVAVQLQNNGGATAKALIGTLSSSSPFVSVTRANGIYPDLAPGLSAASAAPYLISVSPSAPCGAKLPLTFTAAFTGRGNGPISFNFTVQTGRASTTPTTTSYSGPVVAIPDSNAAGVNIPLNVSGGSIAKVVLRLDGTACDAGIGTTTVGVDHTWVGDLIFRLTSPSGTTATLINQAGGALNSGNNFCQTVLVDGSANSIQAVTPGQAPFTGTFSPANPESIFSGENASGVWTLNVSDNAALDTGHVRAFSLDVSGFSCDP